MGLLTRASLAYCVALNTTSVVPTYTVAPALQPWGGGREDRVEGQCHDRGSRGRGSSRDSALPVNRHGFTRFSGTAESRVYPRTPVARGLPEHLQRHLHPPERCAHLDALHRPLHLLEHLARDRDALGERRLFALVLRLLHSG